MKQEKGDDRPPLHVAKTPRKFLPESRSPRRSPNVTGKLSPASQSPHHGRHMVRKGAGITGSGTKNISPHLSGRLTLGMLHKTKINRQADNEEFA